MKELYTISWSSDKGNRVRKTSSVVAEDLEAVQKLADELTQKEGHLSDCTISDKDGNDICSRIFHSDYISDEDIARNDDILYVCDRAWFENWR